MLTRLAAAGLDVFVVAPTRTATGPAPRSDSYTRPALTPNSCGYPVVRGSNCALDGPGMCVIAAPPAFGDPPASVSGINPGLNRAGRCTRQSAPRSPQNFGGSGLAISTDVGVRCFWRRQRRGRGLPPSAQAPRPDGANLNVPALPGEAGVRGSGSRVRRCARSRRRRRRRQFELDDERHAGTRPDTQASSRPGSGAHDDRRTPRVAPDLHDDVDLAGRRAGSAR